EVRQYLEQNYGEKRLYHDGLNVRTTLDPALQQMAEEALRNGLLALDRRQGWRGPQRNVLQDTQPVPLESFHDPSWETPPRVGDLVRGLVRASSRRAI